MANGEEMTEALRRMVLGWRLIKPNGMPWRLKPPAASGQSYRRVHGNAINAMLKRKYIKPGSMVGQTALFVLTKAGRDRAWS